MKIKLCDLQSNPYRDLEKYRLKQERIDALKASISQTGFWDNILARKHPDISGKYQLAYGHNRLEALRQLEVKEINIPVKNISDADMVRIMATENREQYEDNQSILIETVATVRDYLNGELRKFERWEEFKNSDLMNLLEQESEKAFNKLKAGVGQTTILKFLGGGWKQWKIQHALNVLDSKEINRQAVQQFESTGMGTAFVKAIKEINNETKTPVDFEEQMRIAEKIKDIPNGEKSKGKSGGGSYYGGIKEIIKDSISPEYIKPENKKKTESNAVRSFDELIETTRYQADLFIMNLTKLISLSDIIRDDFYATSHKLGKLDLTISEIETYIKKFKNLRNEKQEEFADADIENAY